jgi:hypothetical protein
MVEVMDKPKRIRPNLKMIGVDNGTLVRLKKAANGMPLSTYLRNWSYELSGMPPEPPEIPDPIACRLDSIEKDINNIRIILCQK